MSNIEQIPSDAQFSLAPQITNGYRLMNSHGSTNITLTTGETTESYGHEGGDLCWRYPTQCAAGADTPRITWSVSFNFGARLVGDQSRFSGPDSSTSLTPSK